MPVMGFTKFERFFRAAGGVEVDRDDIKRYLDFVNDALYDLLLIGQATAKANARDVMLPWDLPVTKGLQESVHAFERFEEMEVRPASNPWPRAATTGCRAGRRYPGLAPAALRRHQRRPDPDVHAHRRRAQGRAHPRMGTHVRTLPAAHLSRTRHDYQDGGCARRPSREAWGYSDSHVSSHRRNPMAALPVRRGGRNTSVVNPSREFEDIYDRMGQLMNFAFGLTPAALADMPWVPTADLSETDDAYVVKAELPGVNKDQGNIQLQDREPVISGEGPAPKNGNGSPRHRSSRRTGQFELRTYLPGDVNADAVAAQLSDGILTVTVPKSEAAKPRKIEITG